jgi:hypothetical protein
MGKRKREHKFINNIEHKHCCRCDQWKVLDKFGKDKHRPDGKYCCCKSCKKNKENQGNKKRVEKRKKARDEAPTGFLVCLFVKCTVKEWLQPLDQFIHPHVRNEKYTDGCMRCRNKEKEVRIRREAPCLEVWDEYRKTHPCVICMKDPNYEHNYLLIEADHRPELVAELGKKVLHCGNIAYWSHSNRGVPALKAELKKCQALCRFHHRIVTQQRDSNNGKIEKTACKLRKRAIINAEKHKRGCCLTCKRSVKEGEECAFDFDHRDPATKFEYKGKVLCPTKFVGLPQALFDAQWPIEKELVDLLCANCHKLKTHLNGDGLKT